MPAQGSLLSVLRSVLCDLYFVLRACFFSRRLLVLVWDGPGQHVGSVPAILARSGPGPKSSQAKPAYRLTGPVKDQARTHIGKGKLLSTSLPFLVKDVDARVGWRAAAFWRRLLGSRARAVNTTANTMPLCCRAFLL